MNVYTLQVGRRVKDTIRALEHSGPLSAKDVVDAINKAKRVINSRSWHADTNLVRLLEDHGDNGRVVWTRPMIVARDM
jgi:hypothetical protein